MRAVIIPSKAPMIIISNRGVKNPLNFSANVCGVFGMVLFSRKNGIRLINGTFD
jgi:hypothetical protein